MQSCEHIVDCCIKKKNTDPKFLNSSILITLQKLLWYHGCVRWQYYGIFKIYYGTEIHVLL